MHTNDCPAEEHSARRSHNFFFFFALSLHKFVSKFCHVCVAGVLVHVIIRIFFFFAGVGGFLPGVKQIANVASLPGIVGVRRISLSNSISLYVTPFPYPFLSLFLSSVPPPLSLSLSLLCFSHGFLSVSLPLLPQRSIGLPDVHSGYGFAIGKSNTKRNWFLKKKKKLSQDWQHCF